MVSLLCNKLLGLSSVSKIILTLNIDESFSFPDDDRLFLVKNYRPKGFGANHNAAFTLSNSKYFVVMNPDIDFSGDVFGGLVDCLEQTESHLVAPLVLSPKGNVEDNFRRFPTPVNLVLKAFGWDASQYFVVPGDPVFYPQWVAGMFMLFDAKSFADVGGFDENFYLYYEDVDIGVRFWQRGFRVVACPSITVVHDAQRDSRRRMRFMLWHAKSMARFFRKHFCRLPVIVSGK